MSFPRPRKRQRLDTGYHTPTQPLAHTKHSATDQPGVPSSNQHPYHRASPVSATGMNNPYQGEIIDLTGNDNGRYPDHDARHLGGPYLLDSARSREHTHGSDPQQHYHAVDLLEDDFGGYDVYRGAMHGYHNQSASQPSQRFRGGVKKDMVCERPTKLDANLLPQRATYQGVSVVTPPDGTQRYPFDIDPSPTSSHHAHIGLGAPITPPPSQNPSSHPTPSMAPMSRASVTRPPPIPDIPPAINSDGEPVLSGEQQKLLSLMLSRKNVFYTGSAGTGKSTVLRAFVKKATEQKRHVNIIAPTGIAALNINGTSTWAYAGWTPDSHKKPLQELLASAHGKTSWDRLFNTQILIIDEISMVENLHFERLNAVMKEARGSHLPFGGVQLIVTGDFTQLPPVKPFEHCIDCGSELRVLKYKDIVYKCPKTRSGEARCRKNGRYEDKDKWAFRSDAWKECNFVHVNLTEIHRQSDAEFIAILQRLRMGLDLTQQQRYRLVHHKSSTRNAIWLSSKRRKVQQRNDQMFSKIPTPAFSFQCLDKFRYRGDHHPREVKDNGEYSDSEGLEHTLKAHKDHRYDPTVRLKKGMLVLLQTNLDFQAGLVNGSQGVIQDFEPFDPKKMPRVSNNVRSAETHEGPTLVGDYAALREEEIKEFIKDAPNKKWPIVRFSNGVLRTIYADCRVREVGDKVPRCLLSRTQIPLAPGWAITVHKSQGMTLEKVIVDLKDVFEPGQVYVALSRARTLEGLRVESFPTKMIAANPEVWKFLIKHFGPKLGPGYS